MFHDDGTRGLRIDGPAWGTVDESLANTISLPLFKTLTSRKKFTGSTNPTANMGHFGRIKLCD
jgi:hypothetical protein